MSPLLAATTAGLVAYALSEPLMRRGEARGWKATGFEHGTTVLVVALAMGSLALALCARLLGTHLGAAPRGGGAWGLVAALYLAVGLRFWSMATLGASFTRKLRVSEQTQLVESGPYRRLRHPGYLASIVACASATALVAGSWLAGGAALVVVGSAYAYRIHHEERMLLAALGDVYRDYQARTDRLVPWLY